MGWGGGLGWWAECPHWAALRVLELGANLIIQISAPPGSLALRELMQKM